MRSPRTIAREAPDPPLARVDNLRDQVAETGTVDMEVMDLS